MHVIPLTTLFIGYRVQGVQNRSKKYINLFIIFNFVFNLNTTSQLEHLKVCSSNYANPKLEKTFS